MLKNDIDEFLRACNEAIDQLMKKMENVNQEVCKKQSWKTFNLLNVFEEKKKQWWIEILQKIDNVSTDLRANLLITLLENDIVTSETYTLEREKERKVIFKKKFTVKKYTN